MSSDRTPPISTKFPTMGTTIFTVMSALAAEKGAEVAADLIEALLHERSPRRGLA